MRGGLRGLAMIAAVCAAAPAMAMQLTPSPMQAPDVRQFRGSSHKRQKIGLADSSTKWKRGRGAPPKRKLKRNLVTHSRRVRRKHRRAKRAA